MEWMGYAETWCRIACLRCICLWFPCNLRESIGLRSTRSWKRRAGSLSGECARDEESAGAEDGRAGEPVVDEPAHVRLITEFVSPVAGDPHDADLLAAAQ